MSLFTILKIFVFFGGIAVGSLLILRPGQVIEFQRRFYFKINWRMEPVNTALEIRNTRRMGFMIIGVVIACIVYTICLRYIPNGR